MKQTKLKSTGNNIEKHIKNVAAVFRFESMIFQTMARLTSQYGGGQWDFLTTPRGGFYMRAPNPNKIVSVEPLGGGEPINMSCEALSLCINYIVLELLAHKLNDKHLYNLALNLRMDMFDHHEEVVAISQFLD